MYWSPLRAIFILTICIFAFPSVAQSPDAAPVASSAELERVLETLKDDEKRANFIADLEGFVEAQRLQDPETEKSLAALVLGTVSQRMDTIGRGLTSITEELSNIPEALSSAGRFLTDTQERGIWLLLIGQLILILVAGLTAELLSKRLLRRFHLSIEKQSPDSLALKLFLAVLRTVLDFIVVSAFLAASYVTMTLLAPAYGGRVLALALINANVIARIVLAVSKMFLAPHVSAMRILPIDDETANYCLLWIRRLVYLLAYGYFLAAALPALGASETASAIVAKLIGLITAGMLIVLIMQVRQGVADKIRGKTANTIAPVRERLADTWHLIAVLYVIVTCGVWALEVPGGFDYVLRSTVLSLVILSGAYALALVIQKGLQKVFSISAEQKIRFPGLEARANRYLPVLKRGTWFFTFGIAALAILHAWGLDTAAWIATPTGTAIARSIFNIFAIVVISLAVWELISAGIEGYLTAHDGAGNEVARGQRAMTLLPLLRNIVMISLAVLVVLSVLSEMGVNIGPLIAGAGIIGLAVGFGAQTFVKDVITGLFILIEDTVGVGDIVVLGGYKGKVEAISIRSIQLRDLQGDVHRIPFSEVTSTTNRSKIFSFAFFDIGVAYREDVDHCMNVIREVGAEIRQDEAFSATIKEDIEIMGVQSFDDSAVIIRARLKVAPGKQLGIQRAFNRLLKNRFDVEGIEIPFPHRTIYFGVDEQGKAPPAHIQLHNAEQKSEARPKATLIKAPEGESADFDEEPSSSLKDDPSSK